MWVHNPSISLRYFVRFAARKSLKEFILHWLFQTKVRISALARRSRMCRAEGSSYCSLLSTQNNFRSLDSSLLLVLVLERRNVKKKKKKVTIQTTITCAVTQRWGDGYLHIYKFKNKLFDDSVLSICRR